MCVVRARHVISCNIPLTPIHHAQSHTNILQAIQELLADDKLTGRHGENVALAYTAADAVSEMWTAEWWRRTEEDRFRGEEEGVGVVKAILPVILYVDATIVDGTGKYSVKPLSMSLGCFPERVRVRTPPPSHHVR